MGSRGRDDAFSSLRICGQLCEDLVVILLDVARGSDCFARWPTEPRMIPLRWTKKSSGALTMRAVAHAARLLWICGVPSCWPQRSATTREHIFTVRYISGGRAPDGFGQRAPSISDGLERRCLLGWQITAQFSGIRSSVLVFARYDIPFALPILAFSAKWAGLSPDRRIDGPEATLLVQMPSSSSGWVLGSWAS